jgi:pyruvate/2-oxoglutarate dehydrogenase complex dihydrolipoamide dehydrogenase (E3) component
LATHIAGLQWVIWALGDCNGGDGFIHTAYNDYEIVADNLLKADHGLVSDRIQTYALFVNRWRVRQSGAARERR